MSPAVKRSVDGQCAEMRFTSGCRVERVMAAHHPVEIRRSQAQYTILTQAVTGSDKETQRTLQIQVLKKMLSINKVQILIRPFRRRIHHCVYTIEGADIDIPPVR